MGSLLLIVAWTMSLTPAQDEPKKEAPKQEPETVVIEGKKPLTVQDEKQAVESLEKIPGGVDFIPGEDVRKARAADLRDVLQGSPGVFISPRHGQEYRLSIRGSGLQRNFHLQGIKLLEDGIPVNLADGMGDFNTVDPRSMEYAEVYRGANAFRWGSTTLGGAINFVNRTGRTAPAFDARLELGSWTHINAQLAAGRIAEPFDVYVSAGHYGEEGFRPHSQFDTQRLSTNVGWRLADQWDTRMYLVLVRTASEIPGTLTQAQVHDDRRAESAVAEAQDWHRDMDNVRLANKTSWRSGDQQLDFGGYWMYTDLFHPLIWFPALNLGIIDQLTNDGGFFARYTNDQKIAGHRNSLVVGAQASGNKMRDIRYQNPDGNPGAPRTAHGNTYAQNYTGYVQDQFWIAEPFSLVAGFQATFTTRRFNDNFLSDLDGDQSFRERFTGVTPMGGARFQVTPDSQVYANVSRIFEPPQFTELLNVRFDNVTNNGSLFFNDLRAQRGTSAEIGTRGKEGPIQWDIAYYYAWLHRELIATAPFPGVSFVSNADRTVHQGVEASAQIDFLDGFFFRPGYTWSHFKFRNDPAFGDNRLPGVPEHQFNLELGYACTCGAFISVTSEIVPRKYPADYANSVFADRYATYGIRIGYRRDTGVSFFAEIRNVTDQRYVSSVNQVADAAGADQANFHPAFARAYYVGAEVRW